MYLPFSRADGRQITTLIDARPKRGSPSHKTRKGESGRDSLSDFVGGCGVSRVMAHDAERISPGFKACDS
jgi:hypothetical protein